MLGAPKAGAFFTNDRNLGDVHMCAEANPRSSSPILSTALAEMCPDYSQRTTAESRVLRQTVVFVRAAATAGVCIMPRIAAAKFGACAESSRATRLNGPPRCR